MSKRLFVGNLPFGVDDESLHQVFARVGEVASATVITDPYTGRSRGFGFVEMISEEAASDAVEQLNGTDLEGRPLRVDRARPRGSGGPRGARAERPPL